MISENITAKNYAAQAEKSLLSLHYKMKNVAGYDIDSHQCLKLSQAIGRSVHFALPDDGFLLNDGLKGIKDFKINLPFSEITIEYFVKTPEYDSKSQGLVHIPKRLIYCCEINTKEFIDAAINIPLYKDKILKNLKFIIDRNDNKFIIVTSIIFIDGQWYPVPASWVLTQSWDNLDRTIGIDPIVSVNDGYRFSGILLPLLPKTIDEVYISKHGEEAYRFLAHDIGGEVSAVLEFLEALSCSNVKQQNIDSINSRKNISRIKKGKIPIYETKILTVDIPKIVNNKNNETVEYNRSSPRQHLRRGHIRIIGDKRIWVNSCVVGSSRNGVVDKSYNISAGR